MVRIGLIGLGGFCANYHLSRLRERGDGVLAVAIRSALIHDTRAIAFAGAGIMPTSDPIKEWHETKLKFRTIIEALATRRTH